MKMKKASIRKTPPKMEKCNNVGSIIYYLTPHLSRHSTTNPNSEMLSAVLTGNRIRRDERNVRALGMRTCSEKTTFLGKDHFLGKDN